jgi:hypothetical protein
MTNSFISQKVGLLKPVCCTVKFRSINTTCCDNLLQPFFNTTEVVQNKSNLLLKNIFSDTQTSQLFAIDI